MQWNTNQVSLVCSLKGTVADRAGVFACANLGLRAPLLKLTTTFGGSVDDCSGSVERLSGVVVANSRFFKELIVDSSGFLGGGEALDHE